jgi:hypothetical protein
MTTRTDTKKYELLQNSPKVAILVHDFPHVRDMEQEQAQQAQTQTQTQTQAAQGGQQGGQQQQQQQQLSGGEGQGAGVGGLGVKREGSGGSKGGCSFSDLGRGGRGDSVIFDHSCLTLAPCPLCPHANTHENKTNRQHLLHHPERRGARAAGAGG